MVRKTVLLLGALLSGSDAMNMFFPSFKALEGPTPAACMPQKENRLPEFFRQGAGLMQRLGVVMGGYGKSLSF